MVLVRPKTRVGAVDRALASHLCDPGPIPGLIWIEFVGSLLGPHNFFPGTPVFSSHHKPTFVWICCDSV